MAHLDRSMVSTICLDCVNLESFIYGLDLRVIKDERRHVKMLWLWGYAFSQDSVRRCALVIALPLAAQT